MTRDRASESHDRKNDRKKAQLNPFVKLALDIGPLILFFVVNGQGRHFRRHRRLHGGGGGRARWSPMC